MKYNINGVDLHLARNLKMDGKAIKKNLHLKLEEEEKMLDLFEQSVKHCQANNFNDNQTIWNISGFVNLVSMDIKTVNIGIYFAESEWIKRYYARQACLIMYEATEDLFRLMGKDFKQIIKTKIDIAEFELELKKSRQALNTFKTNNQEYLQKVRNTAIAHKDLDILKQIEVIKEINWSTIIQMIVDFESILTTMGSFLQKLINKALKESDELIKCNKKQ